MAALKTRGALTTIGYRSESTVLSERSAMSVLPGVDLPGILGHHRRPEPGVSRVETELYLVQGHVQIRGAEHHGHGVGGLVAQLLVERHVPDRAAQVPQDRPPQAEGVQHPEQIV